MSSNKKPKQLTAKTLRKIYSPKKPVTPPNSLYSGTPSAVRAIQRPRLLRSRYLNQSKHENEPISNYTEENYDTSPIYNPWRAEYHKLIIREKFVKPMTKDPYTQAIRLVSHAIEGVITEEDCCPTLIVPETIKCETFNIRQVPKRSVPDVVRYVKRTEQMPSEQFGCLPPITPARASVVLGSQNKKPIISLINTNNQVNNVPDLSKKPRLLNRSKLQNDVSVIRRPPRKLIMNVSHETIMPLSVYG